MKIRALFLITALCGLLVVMACSDDSTAPANGTLKINMIDSPADYDAVFVEIESVEVHAAGADSNGGWRVVNSTPGTYDLLTLRNGLSALLVNEQLPAGHYTQIRLKLGSGNSVMVDSVSYDLRVPSGMQSGLKLNHEFTIEGGELYEITLDFDAARSVHLTGNGQYMLRPVIGTMAHVVSGGLRGVALPLDARAWVEAVSGTDTLTAWADTLSGSFMFPMIREGLWQVTIAPTAGAYEDSVLYGVPVVPQQVTDLGTITLQPMLP
jgi:hypothetical protein